MASDTSDLVREQGASGRVCAVTLHTRCENLLLNLNGGFKARLGEEQLSPRWKRWPRKIRLFLNLLRHGSILGPVGCRNRMNLLRLESHTRAMGPSRAER